MEKLAAVLICAHVLGDFALQPDWLVKRKREFGVLLLHAAIHGGLVYLFLQAWDCWQAPVFVLVVHALIDRIKLWQGDTAWTFAVDQVLHVGSLLLLAWLLVTCSWLTAFSGAGYQPLVTLAGFIATVHGAGFLVGKVALRLTEENELQLDGLKDAGKWIGQLERTLIFVLILIEQAGGIGFLVAAKFILRFEAAKKQKLAEYVLIGTLMSFSMAIALASITRWALGL